MGIASGSGAEEVDLVRLELVDQPVEDVVEQGRAGGGLRLARGWRLAEPSGDLLARRLRQFLDRGAIDATGVGAGQLDDPRDRSRAVCCRSVGATIRIC